MTKRNMEIFIAVVETGKMSYAAKKLYMTQSSVSQAIAEIEREYNIVLFDRISHNLYLTETGQNFLSYCKQILDLQTEMEEYLSSGVSNMRLRIGATVTVGACIISQIIQRLKEYNPTLRSEVNVGNTHQIEEMLLNSSLDVGLVEGHIHSPNLCVQKVINDKLVVVCAESHHFFGRDTVTVEELAKQQFILREKGSGTREQFETEMKRRNVPIDIVWNCNNSDAIINGVAAGHGISVISRRLVENQICSKSLWTCDIDGVDLSRTFDLVYHNKKYLSPVLKLFTKICQEYETTI